jgi:hypothetical protein
MIDGIISVGVVLAQQALEQKLQPSLQPFNV